MNSEGYRIIWVPSDSPYFEMARSKGYAAEHRMVMAEMVKRPLLSSETVHHIDGDKLNNSPSNLQLRLGRHGKGTRFRCGDCGSQNVQAVAL